MYLIYTCKQTIAAVQTFEFCMKSLIQLCAPQEKNKNSINYMNAGNKL
jgi:hypothetical protein